MLPLEQRVSSRKLRKQSRAGKKVQAGKTVRTSIKKTSLTESSRVVKLEPLTLPEDKIRRLVLRTTSRYKIEPFVRQLVTVMDHLKAGRAKNVARMRTSRRDQSRKILIGAIAKAAKEGRTMAAYHTAFQAALYAYENSLDHLLAFHDYLDGSRDKHPRKRSLKRTLHRSPLRIDSCS